jgi:hypothetical protein
VKILKCSEPVCNTHKAFDNLNVYNPPRPIPETWSCNWHTDPPSRDADPMSPIAHRSAQLAASRPSAS